MEFEMLKLFPQEIEQHIYKFTFSHPCADMIRNNYTECGNRFRSNYFTVRSWTDWTPDRRKKFYDKKIQIHDKTEGWWNMNCFLPVRSD